MDYKQIQYFLELAKQEHVSGTADFLNISQPALSKSIANLEREIGIRLFDRHGNHIRLNEEGKEFAEYAQKSLTMLQHGLLAARQTKYEVKGSVRILCYTFAEIIRKCALEYRQLNPDVKIVIEQAPLAPEENKSFNRFDFLLCAENKREDFFQQEQTWFARALLQEEYYFFISPRYREYPPSVNSLAAGDLKDDLFVTIPRTDLFFSDITYKICQAADFSPKAYYETNDFLVKSGIVGEGKAIAVMPECCEKVIRRLFPDIRKYKVDGYNTGRTIYFMRRKKALMSETALDFWDFVLDYFQLDSDPRD